MPAFVIWALLSWAFFEHGKDAQSISGPAIAAEKFC